VIRAKRRDRHGRGLRGPLAPSEVPISLTRSEKFDDVVREEVQRIALQWQSELEGVEFAVEDVPEVEPGTMTVPLSALRRVSVGGTQTPRIVIFRRPVEARGGDDDRDLAKLVRELVVEEVAGLLGISPDQVDPDEDG
jgi:predicted Zn-dependent protease with MMP-like domain